MNSKPSAAELLRSFTVLFPFLLPQGILFRCSIGGVGFYKATTPNKTKSLKIKKHILNHCIALLILFIVSIKVKAQASLDSQLINLNLAQFINKPIDSFLAKIPAGYTRLIVTCGSSVFLAGGIAVEYPTCDIDIRAYDFQYVTSRNLKRVRPAEAWPIHLMRKEKIASIIIYKNWTIINSAGE